MFASGNPTLPSETPPTLKFLLDFEKIFLKWRKISKKHNIFSKFGMKIQPWCNLYLITFRPLPKHRLIILMPYNFIRLAIVQTLLYSYIRNFLKGPGYMSCA